MEPFRLYILETRPEPDGSWKFVNEQSCRASDRSAAGSSGQTLMLRCPASLVCSVL